jgi:hypothetical protein
MRDAVRVLLADTDINTPIWLDEEIAGMAALQASLIVGRNLPVSPLRVAALLLDALASNYARLSNVTRLLDVTLSPAKVADLKAQAQSLRDQDDECGFMMIEQVHNSWSFRDRWFGQAARRLV